ncbi:MAG: chemotaxis response regulator CheB [Halioglobus sp.]
MNRLSAPRIGILIASEATASGLSEVLQRAGYEVVVESEHSVSRSRIEGTAVLAWVIDTRSEQVFDWVLGAGKSMFPANNAPGVDQKKEFYDWSSDLLQQINATFPEARGEKRLLDATNDSPHTEEFWVLVGSAGAPSAVQRFLNSFKSLPPVGFIYAQHFAVSEQHMLAQLSAENSLFSMEVGIGWHAVEAGRVIVVPPQCQVFFDNFGNITSTRLAWDPPYTPNIEQLFTLLSKANRSPSGVIIFSGMGNDGMGTLSLLQQCGAHIWSQSPQSAVCDSMPQAAIDTGLVDFLGDPEQLALALHELHC